jgi:hypothetical protein
MFRVARVDRTINPEAPQRVLSPLLMVPGDVPTFLLCMSGIVDGSRAFPIKASYNLANCARPFSQGKSQGLLALTIRYDFAKHRPQIPRPIEIIHVTRLMSGLMACATRRPKATPLAQCDFEAFLAPRVVPQLFQSCHIFRVQFAHRVEAATRHSGSIRSATVCLLFACYSAPYSAPFPIYITLVFCHRYIDQNAINWVATYAFSHVNPYVTSPPTSPSSSPSLRTTSSA